MPAQNNSRITVQQLRYLLKATEVGSITAAAKQLGISQSALSESLSQLETTVGFTILQRGRKGALATERGLVFLEEARDIVSRMDTLESKYLASQTTRQHLRVASQSFGFAWASMVELSNLLVGQNCDLLWSLRLQAQIISDVQSGAVDLGFISFMPPTDRPTQKLFDNNPDIEFHEIMQEPVYAMYDLTHPLAQKMRKSISYDELMEYPYFMFEQYVHTELTLNEESYSLIGDVNLPHMIQATSDLLVSPTQLVKNIADVNGYTIWCRVAPGGFSKDEIEHWPVSTYQKEAYMDLAQAGGFSPYKIAIVPIETDQMMRIGYVIKKGKVLNDIERSYIERVWDKRTFKEQELHL